MISINEIKKELQKEIDNADLPGGYYDSFKYTERNNKNHEASKINSHTHPFTIGILVKILWELGKRKKEYRVEVEPRLIAYDGDSVYAKFNPDIIVYENNKAILVIDYESPNSSDCRVITKDMASFYWWVDCEVGAHKNIKYLIITTLPDYKCDKWKFLYSGKAGYNKPVRGSKTLAAIREEVQQNPRRFWYKKHYKEEMKDKIKGEIYKKHVKFINISKDVVTKNVFR